MWLKKFFKKVFSVFTKTKVEPRPNFLLPETVQEYKNFLQEAPTVFQKMLKEKVNYALSFHIKQQEELVVAKLKKLGDNINSAAEVELEKRIEQEVSRIARIKKETEEKEKRKLLNGFSEFNGGLEKWAEEKARGYEWYKILKEGDVINTHTKGYEYGFAYRRVVRFRGKFFLVQSFQEEERERGKLVITHGRAFQEYRPTGRYKDEVIKFVTESVSQMKEEELFAVSRGKGNEMDINKCTHLPSDFQASVGCVGGPGKHYFCSLCQKEQESGE